MATRYTEKEKEAVVSFVKAYDEKNGRGGQAAAKKEFKINPITIKKWCVERGYRPGKSGGRARRGRAAAPPAPVEAAASSPAPAAKASRGRAGGARRGGRKAAAAPAAASRGSELGVSKSLARMVEIQVEIEKLQKEFNSLKTSDAVRKLLS